MFFRIVGEQLRRFRFLWILYAVLLLIAMVLMVSFSAKDLLLAVNSRHSAWADFVFRYITYLGDGKVFILLTIFAFIYKKPLGILFLCSFIFTSMIAQFLKRVIFDDVLRPPALIDRALLHLPRYGDIEIYNSFPSGHATIAFSLAFIIMSISARKYVGALAILGALLVCYSRMYLAKHFLIDVSVGSLIGMLGTLCVFAYLRMRYEKKHPHTSLSYTSSLIRLSPPSHDDK